jgi:hypothetical protein
VVPKPKKLPAAADADDPDDNAPAGDAPGAERPAGNKALPPPVRSATRLVVQLFGKPSLFVASRQRGDLKERLTIFRQSEADPDQLQFVANALIRRVGADGQVEAEVESTSDHCFVDKGKTVRSTVREGDLVATRFFLVRSIKVKSVEAEIETDDDGFPSDVSPAHLDAELSVAAVRFKKLETPKATAPTRKAPGRKRTFKKPRKRY